MQQQIKVPIMKLHPDALIPAYESENAAGMDLRYCPEDFHGSKVKMYSGQRVTLPTGIAMAIPVGYEGQVRPKSGNAHKRGLTVLNAPGTIDADYRGEIGVILLNTSDNTLCIEAGDGIAQIVFAPVAQAELVESESLPETVRGDGKFGSTGNDVGGEA